MRVIGLLALLLGAVLGTQPRALAGEAVVGSELLFSGLSSPTFVAQAPGDASRLFILEKGGLIHLALNDVLQPTPFLDLSALVPGEGFNGLLGIAFHPDYATNGYFYVHHPRGPASSDRLTIARYTVSADPNVADPTSREEILVLPYPGLPGHHLGGWLGFGPDGYLYIPLGDGHTSGFEDGGGARSQSLASPWGKTLRIDVDTDDYPADPDRDFGIPADNPFVGQGGEEAAWVLGLRQPYRAAFDQLTGDFWIADVGLLDREEVNLVPAGSGGGQNFGWNCAEGSLCVTNGNCDCVTTPLVPPVYEYAHTEGCSISGGALYRGTAIDGFQGRFVFGDWCTNRIWSFREQGGVAVDFRELTAELDPSGNFEFILSVCEGGDGELYITDNTSVYRVIGQPWQDLAEATPGTHGDPLLCADGWLEGGDPLSLELSNALESTTAWFAAGVQPWNVPFMGGVFVPDIATPPGFARPFPTNGSGELVLNNTWPVGVPSGFEVYIQFWVVDPQGPFGFSASNALLGITP